MDKVEHKGDSDVVSSRKRDLQDKIKVTWPRVLKNLATMSWSKSAIFQFYQNPLSMV